MPAPQISIIHDHPHLRIDDAALRELVVRVAASEGCAIDSLGIVLSDHATVHRLNAEYLGHDYETDVLSFSLREPGELHAIEGEVYIDLDTAEERAPEFGATFEQEVFRYAVHGLLHLIGYDDHTDEDRRNMRRLEDRYLTAIQP